MERKRKGYLLRKSVSFDSHRGGIQKEPQGQCICNNALSSNSSSRTYDLQTQTVTFGDEEDNSTPPKHHKRFSASSILKKFSSSSTSEEENTANHKSKKQQKPFEMDSPDLEEFYPVDDHPSPSTFTAWDAFLSGTQAFFPASSSAYMDVIPEVEEEEEALLGSDTDDTGSSVSTVVDRFSSRNSTANSSFSERWKSGGGATEVAVPHFDLEKVLSPFEKLEKELDAHQGSRDEDGRKKEIQRGPIVVITNSSSCEDVHSEEDDAITNGQHTSTNEDSNGVDNSTAKMNGTGTVSTENITQKNSDNSTKSISKPKMVNGCKSEKSPAKKAKSDTAIPIPPPPSNPKKKRSYPTPNIPPRMSLHVQARRTRSDPGTPDQPSRIPRPISSTSRSPVSAKKGTPKSYKGSKVSASKKQTDSDNIKLVVKDAQTAQPMELPEVKVGSSGMDLESNQVKESIEVKPQAFDDASHEPVEVTNELDIDRDLDESLPHPDSFEIDPNWNTIPDGKDSFADDPSWDSVSNGGKSFDDDDCWKSLSGGKDSNPFRSQSKTNPFTSDGEEIEVAKGSNPFESEVIPALQPKGQMTAAIMAPPIPERPSLMKREKPVEVLSNPEKIANVLVPINNKQELPEEDEALLLPVSLPPTKGLFSELLPEKTKEDDRTAAVSNSEPVMEDPQLTADVHSFWPKVSTHQEVEILDKFSAEKAEVDALFDNIEVEASALQQRPIEDILQALDQLVSVPREMEISIDWGVGEGVNIRETPLFSAASGDGSCCDEETTTEGGGMAEDRRRCIESLLKEVDECLRTTHKVEEDSIIPESAPIEEERTPLGPGTPDVPSAGYTAPSSPKDHDEAIDVLSNNSSPEMLRHQKHDGQRSAFSTSVYTQDPKNHSPGCDDSGVFLEEPLVSSPETQTRSAISRLHNITQFQKADSSEMRQYSIPTEGLDSDDLGLASSSIDSADDLDGDPLPSTLQICPPPAVPNRQKPPPVPARKSPPQKHSSRFSSELDLANQRKPPLSKSSSSGEDSNFGEGDLYTNEDQLTDLLCHDEHTKNILNHQKSDQSRFAMTKSFHEDTLLGLQRDSQESKSAFLARTLSSSKKLEVPDGLSKISDNSSAFKWKSEECLRTAAESKWSLTGRRFEKSVSVKDRIAMFSVMEVNQTPLKKDLQRYGSENNIKTVTIAVENKKMDLPPTEEHKQQSCLLRDAKWQSLHNISKKSPEKEILYPSSNMKSALSIPSLAPPSSPSENPTGNGYAPFSIKLDVEPPKPIVSTYPQTQLTNNKRYNYGLYSLKNLKNTEDLLSKKAAGSNLLSIIDSRKQPLRKLKGLVIPEKPQQQDGSKTLPTIVSSDSDGSAGTRDNRRASLPITVVTAAVSKSTSLPRNNIEYQKQTSLLTEPPWKSERTTNSSNTLPKYSPAFKKRSLELPGSSLSPTPPSSLTSPLSPPPSSPSSICSSNASSTLQQNVFQFSLSHSKPVQPLLPEKALMSPTPSLQPSDVEYEGDNSEDSSHSAASPMRNAVRAPKENKMAPSPLNSGIMHYETSNTFTSSAKPIVLQPLLVETLVKSTSSSRTEPRAAVCISKTEINLRGQNSAPALQRKSADTSSIQEYLRSKKETKLSSNGKDYRPNEPLVDCISPMHVTITENRNGSYQVPPDFLDGHAPFTNGSTQNGHQPARSVYSNGNSLSHEQPKSVFSNGKKSEEVPVGKFRACPLNLQDRKSEKSSRRQLHSDESEDEDDDSHSTLSHRTEDSRHTTTDDCLSDATTDSFEKPRVANEVPSNLRSTNEDYASTEGYLSDASTDVSLRRFTHRHLDASTEEYLSDATAESPDPDWVSNRDNQDFRNRSYITRNNESQAPAAGGTVDLRPKRLSQQRTVLKASVEPSGSVQKFKALAEKWEQRADVVTSPPPPPLHTTLPAPLLPKKEQPRTATVPLASALFSSASSGTASKGKGSSLPPSLMPRNSSEKKHPLPPPPLLKSPPAEIQEVETNGWSTIYETQVNVRRDSSGSNSSSSKTTLKEVDDTTTSVLQDSLNSEAPVPNSSRTSSLRSDTWNNEPRNRRGADFSRAEYQAPARPSYGTSTKSNFSDIRRNFENGNNNKEEDKSTIRKKTPPVMPDRTPVVTQPPVALPRRASSSSTQVMSSEEDDETRRLIEEAKSQLQLEGGGGLQVLSVLLRREGTDGGSVGITLAGGADYEVKEITVHKVISGSIADRDGRVMKGDRVMSINSRDVRGVSHGEALHILKAPNPKVLLVLARIADTASGQHRTDSGKTEGKRQSALCHQDAETFLVELQKDATGVGFSIEGGKDSPQGDRPLLIKRLFKGGAADKEGRLEEGDEILSINNHPVTNMTRTEAWNFLKKLPEGVVQLHIKKSKATALMVS